MENSKISEKRIPKYIENRLGGDNKMQSMLKVGYTETKSRSPSLIEATKTYALNIQAILGATSQSMKEAIVTVTVEELASLPVMDRLKALKYLAEVHKILTPTIRIKEEEMKDGSIKRTKWQGLGE